MNGNLSTPAQGWWDCHPQIRASPVPESGSAYPEALERQRQAEIRSALRTESAPIGLPVQQSATHQAREAIRPTLWIESDKPRISGPKLESRADASQVAGFHRKGKVRHSQGWRDCHRPTQASSEARGLCPPNPETSFAALVPPGVARARPARVGRRQWCWIASLHTWLEQILPLRRRQKRAPMKGRPKGKVSHCHLSRHSIHHWWLRPALVGLALATPGFCRSERSALKGPCQPSSTSLSCPRKSTGPRLGDSPREEIRNTACSESLVTSQATSPQPRAQLPASKIRSSPGTEFEHPPDPLEPISS